MSNKPFYAVSFEDDDKEVADFDTEQEGLDYIARQDEPNDFGLRRRNGLRYYVIREILNANGGMAGDYEVASFNSYTKGMDYIDAQDDPDEYALRDRTGEEID